MTNDPQGAFNMQHDARFAATGDITLFDDHGATAGVARGIEYAIDHTNNVATVAWQYLGTAKSQFEGSLRRYEDGEGVIGWGYIPTDPDVAFDTGQQSYRAVKVPLAQLDIDVLRKTAAK